MTKKDRIFLAYASEDRALVYELYEKLKIEGFSPWLDHVDIIAGQNWRTEIFNAIEKSAVFIACISNYSIQKEGFVQKEFRHALDIYAQKPLGSIFLIPLKFDECDVPDIRIHELNISLRDIHWINYFQPYSFNKLKQSISNALKPLSPKDQTSNLSTNIKNALLSIRVGVIHNKGLIRIFRVYINEKPLIIKFVYNYYQIAFDDANPLQVFVNDEIAYHGNKLPINFVIYADNKEYVSKINFEDNQSGTDLLNLLRPRKFTKFSFEIEGKIFYSE